MKMLDLVPMLETESTEKTIDFYTNVLFFKLKGTLRSAGRLTWIMLEWERAGLMFSSRFEAAGDRDHSNQSSGHRVISGEKLNNINRLKLLLQTVCMRMAF